MDAQRMMRARGLRLASAVGIAVGLLLLVAALAGAAGGGRWDAPSNGTPPESRASCPEYANATIQVSYVATDDVALDDVRLFFRREPDTAWTYSVLRDTFPVADQVTWVTGTFPFDPPGADGRYGFQTIAGDHDGFDEVEQPAADCVTIFDSYPPGSTGSPPGYNADDTIPVDWLAWDAPSPGGADGSGVHGVTLWHSVGEGGFVSTTYHAQPGITMSMGTFNYDPMGVDGLYCFETVARDKAGNEEHGGVPPGSAADCTTQDTISPTAETSAPAMTDQITWQVSWSGDDPLPGSGIDKYDVDYRIGDGDWKVWLTGFSGNSHTFGLGDPLPMLTETIYYVRARAYDLAGNLGDYGSPASTQFLPVVYRISLPLIHRGGASQPIDPYEENDSWSTAYGPIVSGTVYMGRPDDKYDYFYLELPISMTLVATVTGYAPTSAYGDLLLAGPSIDGRGEWIDQFGISGDYTTMVINRWSDSALGPGRYDLLVHTAEEGGWSSDSEYGLEVSYQVPGG